MHHHHDAMVFLPPATLQYCRGSVPQDDKRVPEVEQDAAEVGGELAKCRGAVHSLLHIQVHSKLESTQVDSDPLHE